MKKSVLATLVLIPSSVLACWQAGGPLHQIQNDAIKARLTYDLKPIANAPVTLWTRKKGLISSTHTDKNGWFAFKDVAPGEYRVTLVGSSYEPFEVVLSPAKEYKTELFINFYADWCRDVSIIRDR